MTSAAWSDFEPYCFRSFLAGRAVVAAAAVVVAERIASAAVDVADKSASRGWVGL